MLKNSIIKNIISIIPDLLKDKNKKWSAKRTISGVLVYVIAEHLQTHELSWMIIVFTLVSLLPICLSFFEKKPCQCK
jgi:uncharacterized protein YfaT (DUF1175 family)